MCALKLVLRAKRIGAQCFARHLSVVASTPPLLTVKLPKLEEPRNFVIATNMNLLKDLQDAIIAEDSSVHSINAISSEGGSIYKLPLFSCVSLDQLILISFAVYRLVY